MAAPPVPDDPHTLPEPPVVPDPCACEMEKIRYQARVDLATARSSADIALEKLEYDTAYSLTRSFHESLMEIAKSSLDRAKSGAEAVRTAAAAIGVIYAGALGLAFSVTDRPLPLRGAIPAFFLGLAIAMATAFLAILTQPPEDTEWPAGGKTFVEDAQERTGAFITYVRDVSNHKAHMLRAAMVSLGIGVVFLPVGFIGFGIVAASPQTQPGWPSPPAATGPVELQVVLYQAQVLEVAEQRRAIAEVARTEDATSPGALLVYGLAVAGFIWVLILFFGSRTPGDPAARSISSPDDGAG